MVALHARNALVVARPSGRAELASLARRAGWGAIEADGFGQARFLLNMKACDGVVISDDHAGPDFPDGLAWLAAQLPAPPVLVAAPTECVVLAALRHGVLWVPPDALRACPALLGALLEQANALGEQRGRAARAEADRAEAEARADRLRDMLWEAAPVEGEARRFTQRHMLERLDEEVERCRRSGAPLAVVLGEVLAPPGSALPREQADRLAGWLLGQVGRAKRRSDVAGHYGRNGVLMILPQTTAEQARGACWRLSRVLPHPPCPGPPGVRPCFAPAALKGNQASVPALLRRAEECLEQARAGASEVVAG